MAATWQQPSFAIPPKSYIRIVIADPDPARRHTVRGALLCHCGYNVIGEAGSAEEVARIVAEESPELVFCAAVLAPEQGFLQQAFPLFVTIGRTLLPADRVVCALEDPIRPAQVSDALSVATARILTIKAGELSTLIHKYVLHGDPACDLVNLFHSPAEGVPLSPDEVRWIQAAGNYVQFHTDNGMYEVRDSIRNVALRLGRSGFLRLHRRVVVNASAIRYKVVQNDVPVAVVLADGTQLQVGPSFRDQVPGNVPLLPSTVPS